MARRDGDPEFSDALASRLRTVRGVEEVAVLGVWAEAIESGVRAMTQIAVGLFLLVSVACVSIVWSTIAQRVCTSKRGRSCVWWAEHGALSVRPS